MIVESEESAVWERLGHQNGGRSETTSNVGRLRTNRQPVLDPIEGRNPLINQMRLIAGTEEPVGAMAATMMMLVPPDAFSTLDRASQALPVQLHRSEHRD